MDGLNGLVSLNPDEGNFKLNLTFVLTLRCVDKSVYIDSVVLKYCCCYSYCFCFCLTIGHFQAS